MGNNGPDSMRTDDDTRSERLEQIAIDAALVVRARTDDPDAFGELYERWFARVYDLANRITRDSDMAADVAQDTFLAAWRQLGRLQDADAFGGWLLRITRNTALNRRKKERRSSPRDDEGMMMIEEQGPRVDAPTGFTVEERASALTDPARAAEDREVAELVWESAEALGTNDAVVLDLTLRHGLTPAEIGEIIGVNRNAANQTVHRVRGRLRSAVEARVLWRGGEPVCCDLADALSEAGVTRFGSDAVRVTSEHVEKCERCAARRALRLEPSALFAATPFIAAPLVKQNIAHALSMRGVPLGRGPVAGDSPGKLTDGSSGPASEGESNTALEGSHRRSRLGRVAAGFGGLLVVVLVSTIVFAEGIDEAGLHARRVPSSEAGLAATPSSAPATPISEAPTTGAPRADDRPAAAAPDTLAQPPPPPLPPPPPVSGSISIDPSAASSIVFPRPTLSWHIEHASSVQIIGPGGFSSALASGSASVCPGNAVGPDCTTPAGRYTYTVRATDATGSVVFEHAATFTVG